MSKTEFMLDALSTESIVDSATTSVKGFASTLAACVAASQLLDQFKRQIFYKTDVNLEKFENALSDLEAAIKNIRDVVSASPDGNINMAKDAVDLVGPTSGLSPMSTRVIHGAAGAHTETGELLEAILAGFNGDFDTVNMAEEIGDVEWYLHVLADAVGLSVEQCQAAVTKKLKDKKRGRYADGFNTDSAVNRNLTQERSSLETSLNAQ